MNRLLIIFACLSLSSCIISYNGNVSSGSSFDCPLIYVARGSSKATFLFGMGSKDALILDAKEDLYSRYPYRPNIKLTNFSVDILNNAFLFFTVTTVTVSVDVYNCEISSDSLNGLKIDILKSNQKINGFNVGDSILYDQDKLIPAVLISHFT